MHASFSHGCGHAGNEAGTKASARSLVPPRTPNQRFCCCPARVALPRSCDQLRALICNKSFAASTKTQTAAVQLPVRDLRAVEGDSPNLWSCKTARPVESSLNMRVTSIATIAPQSPAFGPPEAVKTVEGVSCRVLCATRFGHRSILSKPTTQPDAVPSMTPTPPPALPADVMRRIAHMTFAAEAEESRGEEVWARLSSVGRMWRETLRGAVYASCDLVVTAGGW